MVIQLPRCPKCWRLVLPEYDITFGVMMPMGYVCRNEICSVQGQAVVPEWTWAMNCVDTPTPPVKEA